MITTKKGLFLGVIVTWKDYTGGGLVESSKMNNSERKYLRFCEWAALIGWVLTIFFFSAFITLVLNR